MMSDDGLPSIPPSIRGQIQDPNPNPSNPNPNPNPSKRRRSLPGNPDPEAEVIALSPESLMAKNRFICEICNRGFQRDQNLQLHRRGHNLPWKLKQRSSKEVIRKKVYICPEKTCVHHHPSTALGDLTGVKKHYSRKHGEKKWECTTCSKKYAVLSDLKAHSKICGTREYKCDCGTLFSRKDSFITHRAFCDALAGETAGFRTPINPSANSSFRNEITDIGFNNLHNGGTSNFSGVFRPQIGGLESGNHHFNQDLHKSGLPLWLDSTSSQPGPIVSPIQIPDTQTQWPKVEEENNISSSLYFSMNHGTNSPAPLSATALLQKAAQMGPTRSSHSAVLGLMGSSGGYGPFDRTSNEAHQTVNGFMASTSASTLSSNNSGECNLVVDDTNSNSGVMNSRINEGGNSLTRDFLGVGGKENRQNYLQEFAYEMEMGRYMGRNH